MKTIALLFFLIFVVSQVISQNKFAPVIIDTDGGTDDFRALTAFLAAKDLNILAITSSSGTLTSQQTFENIDRLITSLNRNIPIAQGTMQEVPIPSWRNECLQLSWGHKQRYWPPTINVYQLMEKKIVESNEKVVYIALGSLTHIASFLVKNANLKTKFEKILWYNPSIESQRGYNYELDKPALQLVINSGIQLEIISNLHIPGLKWNDNLIYKLSDSIASTKFLKKKLIEKEMQYPYMMDEIVASYFFFPKWFTIKTNEKRLNVIQVTDIDTLEARECLIKVYNNDFIFSQNSSFEKFTTTPSSFKFDIAKKTDLIIKKHGIDEWKACILASEIHASLNIYTIIGAKMGVKARAFLKAPIDSLLIFSNCGIFPFNDLLIDGLHASTGVIVNKVKIKNQKSNKDLVSSIFEYKGVKIKLFLKHTYQDSLKKEIELLSLKQKLSNEEFQSSNRKLVIKYWLDWNRNDIFEIEKLK